MSGLGKNNRPQTPEKTAENRAHIFVPLRDELCIFCCIKPDGVKGGDKRG